MADFSVGSVASKATRAPWLLYLTTPRTIVVALVVAICGLCIAASYTTIEDLYHEKTYTPQFGAYQNPNQYADMADSLLSGRLYLDYPIAKALTESADPYDQAQRLEIASEEDPFYWDHAYYNGKYYMYFGVAPAIFLYLPWRVLTGQQLDTVLACQILSCVCVVGIAMLVWRIASRWFAELGVGLRCLGIILVFSCSKIVCMLNYPMFYEVPILSSLACALFGLWFWMGARRDRTFPALSQADQDFRSARSEVTLSLPFLCAGSWLMALMLACRPQFILTWALAFPLFWREIVSERLLFSRKGLMATIVAVAPFVIVGCLVGWYNWLRFDSPFTFGEAYNLTGWNMTDYHQDLRFALLQYVVMLFAPFVTSPTFPFFKKSLATPDLVGDAWGYGFNQAIIGGYFWSVPTALFSFALPWVGKALHGKRILGVVITLFAYGFIVCWIDVFQAGISPHYMADFAWAFALVALFCFFSLYEQAGRQDLKKIVVIVAITLIAASFVIGFFAIFSPDASTSGWYTWRDTFVALGLAQPEGS